MKRILVIQFKHETNSFCPYPADYAAFHARNALEGAEIVSCFEGTRNEMGAFFDYFRPYSNEFELVPCIAYNAEPSAPVTGSVYRYVTETVKGALRIQESVDGILLSLHGAMVAEGHPDGEGDFLETLRRMAGPKVPVVASLDLHANVTKKMVEHSTALFPFLEYPHIDGYETGLKAAQCMHQILSEGLPVYMGYKRIPYLLPLFPTEFPQLKKVYQMIEEGRKEEGLSSAMLCHGFFPADIEEMGMSVITLANDSAEHAAKAAARIGEAVWNLRDTLVRTFCKEEDVLSAIQSGNRFPVVIADASDNPGAGGTGDTTHILRFLLEHKIEGGAVATITDSESVEACIAAGVGRTVELLLGGKADETLTGGPLPVSARIRMITDGVYINKGHMDGGLTQKMGPCALVDIGGNDVILSSLRTQPFDAEVFRTFGIQPEQKKFLVVKSAVHYRASFGQFAARMMEMALPGYAPPLPENLTYKNYKTCPFEGQEKDTPKIHSRVYADIDLDAVEYNYQQIKNHLAPGTGVISVLKADGYGCGAVPIARVVEPFPYVWGFATATVEEALDLRKNGVAKPILILGYTFPDAYEAIVKYELRPAVFTETMASRLSEEAQKQKKTVHVHIAVDTGMGRIGVKDCEESISLLKNIASLPCLETEGIFTHFARADEYDKSFTHQQLRRFQAFVKSCEDSGIVFSLRHCSNSAGIIDLPEANMDCVRSGIVNYGLYPSDEVDQKQLKLKPILSMKSHVAYIKKVEQGTSVSYGGTWVSPCEKTLATIPVGYGDGYCRHLSNKGHVLIRGKKAPIVGRVCMDQMMVDVSDIPEAREGDLVTFIGTDMDECITMDELEKLSGRYRYEFLCDITKRVPRVYHYREIQQQEPAAAI